MTGWGGASARPTERVGLLIRTSISGGHAPKPTAFDVTTREQHTWQDEDMCGVTPGNRHLQPPPPCDCRPASRFRPDPDLTRKDHGRGCPRALQARGPHTKRPKPLIDHWAKYTNQATVPRIARKSDMGDPCRNEIEETKLEITGGTRTSDRHSTMAPRH